MTAHHLRTTPEEVVRHVDPWRTTAWRTPASRTTPWRTTAEAEHDVEASWRAVPPTARVTWAATHFLPDHAGVAVTVEDADGALEVLGAPEPAHAQWALEHHRRRTGGRLFRFPGVDGLTGTTAVGALLGLSAVDEVVGVGAPSVDPATPVRTRDFVRPTFTDGRVRLLVRPAAGGAVAPFEQPDPTPCCADHA